MGLHRDIETEKHGSLGAMLETSYHRGTLWEGPMVGKLTDLIEDPGHCPEPSMVYIINIILYYLYNKSL